MLLQDWRLKAPLFGILLVLTFLLSGTVGFWFGDALRKRVAKGPEVQTVSKLAQIAIEESDRDFENTNRSPSSDTGGTSYAAILERHHLEERDRKLLALFSSSETGRILAKYLVLAEFNPAEKSIEGQLRAEFLKLLESQPIEVLHEIRNSLGRLGSEYQSERENLIQMVSSLDLNLTEKADFFTEQLAFYDPKLDLKQNRFTSAVTLLTMIQAGIDSSVIEPSLKQALENQPNYSTRSLLLSIYESRYPEDARHLKVDLGL